MRFAELTPGRVVDCGTETLTDEQIVAFARDYDPQPFHVDAERARASEWSGLIASGWQTCGIAMRLIHQAILDGSESVGSPGLAYLEWKNPVRAGDVLRCTVEVIEQRTSRKNPSLGIIRWRWQLANQDGAPVLDTEVTNLFDLSRAA
jgi:acyl dehydratase